MRRLAEHAERLRGQLDVRAIYVDLDGTLLGPGGSLFASSEGGSTTRAAEAAARLREAGVALIPMSGRTEAQVLEVARVLGADGFIAELGGIVARGGEIRRRRGAAPGDRPPVEAMVRSGAAGLLLELGEGRLVPHTPWSDLPRESTLLFRGHVDEGTTTEALSRSGYNWVALSDNGIIGRSFDDLDVDEVHAYHLAPVGVAKSDAVADDLSQRGLRPEDAIVVGDAPADVAAGAAAGATFLVANGAWAARKETYVTRASFGEGFAEVVEALL